MKMFLLLFLLEMLQKYKLLQRVIILTLLLKLAKPLSRLSSCCISPLQIPVYLTTKQPTKPSLFFRLVSTSLALISTGGKLLLYCSRVKCLGSLCGLLCCHQCRADFRQPCIQLPDLLVLHFKLLILMLQFTLQHGNQRRFGGFASFATWFRMLRNLLSLNSPIMLIYQCFCGFVDCETCFRIFRNMVSPTPCTDCLL